MFALRMIVLLLVAVLAGCGGGGGGSSESLVCTSDVWLPDVSTVRDGEEFVQTNECGETRTAIGTKSYWVYRSADTHDTAQFMTFVGQSVDAISPDGAGGVFVFGVNSTERNNKGMVSRLDSSGNQLWLAEINSPLGNTLRPDSISSNGNLAVVLFSREPLRNNYVYGIGMDGSPRALAEVSIGNNLESATVGFDGDNLLVGMTHSHNNYSLMVANMTGGIPESHVISQWPQFITVDEGYNVVGGVWYMQYAKTPLTENLIQPQTWTTGTTINAHSVVQMAGRTYAAGVSDGNYAIAELGNPAFRNTAAIPVGNDRVQIGVSGNDMYVSIGERFGKVNVATGEMASRFPVAIPPNVPWVISGHKAYFADKASSTVHVLDLSIFE